MSLKPFNQLPDHSRLWIFSADRRLTAAEAARLLPETDTFLNQWTAHKVALAAARDWRYDQFLFVAVDEATAGASGCSIDALVRFVREEESRLGVHLTDNSPVWFRARTGRVESVSRAEFQRMAEQGDVTPRTVVFDNTVESVGALREGKWETQASNSWHGRAFFNAAPVLPR